MSGLFSLDPLSQGGAQRTGEESNGKGISQSPDGTCDALRATLSVRQPGRIRPSLHGLRQTLKAIGNPQYNFRSILVVGTNGKGSTAAMLERILAAAGLKTGLYTSPHLIDPTERLRCSGDDLSCEELSELVSLFDSVPELTYFETLTAAAFVLFARRGVDVAILEAGMGGRWDATRLAESAVAGLTNVGSDHASWLGASRVDIAADKGAALAAAKIALLGPGVDAEIVEHLGAPSARFAQTTVNLERTPDPSTAQIRWGAHPFASVHCPLAGRHQFDNLHLALALAVAAEEIGWVAGLSPNLVQRALPGVRWPGRCSSASVHERSILLDGAHNIESVTALVAYLRTLGKIHNLLFTCLNDKPVEEMAAILRPAVGTVAIFEIDGDRAMPLDRLRNAFPGAGVGLTAIQALNLLDDPVVAAGSLRLVGELLRGSSS